MYITKIKWDNGIYILLYTVGSKHYKMKRGIRWKFYLKLISRGGYTPTNLLETKAIANNDAVTTLIQDYDVQLEKQLDEINVKLKDLENTVWAKDTSFQFTDQPTGQIYVVLTWTAPQLSGYYMCYANISSTISDDRTYPVTLLAPGATALTENYTSRGSMLDGGGVDITRLFYFEGGETVQVQTYNSKNGWTARTSFFAIRISS